MRNRTRTPFPLLGVASLLLAASSLQAHAVVQLIHMSNGKVLKADRVEADGDWLLATLEGGSTIGFPSDEVALIEADPLGREEIGAPANVVTSGRELPPRATFPSQNRTSPLDRQNLEAAAQEAGMDDDGVTEEVQPEAVESGEVNLAVPAVAVPGAPPRSRRLGVRTRAGDDE